MSLVKAAMTSPPAYMRNNMSNLLTSSDLQNMSGKNKAKTIQVNAMIRTAKVWFKDVVRKLNRSEVKDSEGKPLNVEPDYMTEAEFNRILGDMQCHAVLFIMGKKSRRSFGSLNAIKVDFMGDMYVACPPSADVESPFGNLEVVDIAKLRANGGACSSASASFVAFEEDGSVDKSTLQNLGFVVQNHVQLIKPPGEPTATYEIKKFEGNYVFLNKVVHDSGSDSGGEHESDEENEAPVQRVIGKTAAADQNLMKVVIGVLMDTYKVCAAKPSREHNQARQKIRKTPGT
jgi:hypothetical protein